VLAVIVIFAAQLLAGLCINLGEIAQEREHAASAARLWLSMASPGPSFSTRRVGALAECGPCQTYVNWIKVTVHPVSAQGRR
jgi:hypothetical protein